MLSYKKYTPEPDTDLINPKKKKKKLKTTPDQIQNILKGKFQLPNFERKKNG